MKADDIPPPKRGIKLRRGLSIDRNKAVVEELFRLLSESEAIKKGRRVPSSATVSFRSCFLLPGTETRCFVLVLVGFFICLSILMEDIPRLLLF